MIRAFIFDFEGVIVDSEPVRYETWRVLFKDKFGIDLPEYGPEIFKQICGRKQSENIRYFLEIFKLEGDVDELIKERARLLFEVYDKPGNIKPVKGLLELLEFLKQKKIKIAIATSSYSDTTEKVLEELKIKAYFEIIVTGEEIEKGKPAPDLFLKTAEKLGLESSECVVVEDSLNGVKAAKSAEMMCVAVTTTFPREYLKDADLVVDDLEEIIQKYNLICGGDQ